MEALAQRLCVAIPTLSPIGRDIMTLLADAGGGFECPDSVATDLHLRDRHHLARVLKREGLPQIEELSAWIKVLRLLEDWEVTHRSLYSMAIDATFYPPTCYRMVKRITGKTWRQACDDGFGIMLVRFVSRCMTIRGEKHARVSMDLTQSV